MHLNRQRVLFPVMWLIACQNDLISFKKCICMQHVLTYVHSQTLLEGVHAIIHTFLFKYILTHKSMQVHLLKIKLSIHTCHINRCSQSVRCQSACIIMHLLRQLCCYVQNLFKKKITDKQILFLIFFFGFIRMFLLPFSI